MSSLTQTSAHPHAASRSLPAIDAVLADPTVSYWLKDALRSAVARDPLDALRDATVLRDVLEQRLDQLFAQGGV